MNVFSNNNNINISTITNTDTTKNKNKTKQNKDKKDLKMILVTIHSKINIMGQKQNNVWKTIIMHRINQRIACYDSI